jgi:hypothetical protein
MTKARLGCWIERIKKKEDIMKFTIVTTLVLAVLFGAMASTSNASTATGGFTTFVQDDCVVIGNNSVPLRVRSAPNGRIIGKLKIGSHVTAWDLVTDRNGNYWTKIGWGRGFGFVSTQYISCG